MHFSTLNPTRLILPVLLLQQAVNAHSWVEQVSNIASNGTMTGTPGYIRGWRGRDGFDEKQFAYLLPTNGRQTNGLENADTICPPVEKLGAYNDQWPMLTTSPGSFIAMRYQENGHVTIPGTQENKPKNRGTVYIYGTTEATNDDKFLDIRKWNAEGTGGNKKGKLLATRNYDDQRCYQVNNNENGISVGRQAKTPKTPDALQGVNLWCQSDIQLPSDLAVTSEGKPYTLYWLWAWPTMNRPDCPNDQNDQANNCTVAREEFYSSCMDVKIVKSDTSVKAAKDGPSAYDNKQDPNQAADPAQLTVGKWQVTVSNFDAPSETRGGAAPSSTGAAKPSSSSGAKPSGAKPTTTDKPVPAPAPTNGHHVKTVTVTVPAATKTIWASETTSATRRARRTAGEWGFGH